MSSDDLFEDDGYDDAFFEELDRVQSTKNTAPKAPSPVLTDDDSFDMTFEFDETDLAMVDNQIQQQTLKRKAGPSTSRQTTLYGDILPTNASTSTDKAKPRNPFGQQAPKTKQWDHTQFSKTGVRKSKGKGRASFKADEEDEDEEEVEFEQFPAPFVSLGPPPPMTLSPDLLEAKHWIYPLNQEKRDYQYNIVQRCLFDNTIVALPTGLGKTFISGVVMLNYYRWFPEGKVVFVAPTKPLVAQQIEACHKTCGIPGSDAIELTGQNPKPMRARAWREKRVFYMTPQTFINDLMSENCDVRSIILVVFDEAHRATGDYAYNQVVRWMMAKNPHFRILALTATPGSNPEAVQNLIDGLHISRIEIRDENSLDLKAYIHEKKVEQHIIKMTDEIVTVRDLLVKLMEGYMKPVLAAGILRGGNLANMHPYAFQGRMQGLPTHQRKYLSNLSMLSSLARSMGYLIEGTMNMCHKSLVNLASEEDGPQASKGKKGVKLRVDLAFQAVMKQLEFHNARGFPTHPKMERLTGLILQHLTAKLPDDPDATPESTKIMVFATHRDCVEEIVASLNEERPIVRASRFIGQGTDKHGRKGLAQREQLEVIKRFKEDEFNVLVATSIGEEGLDIGEVDLIVCYDAQKTPIRMLQRLGRTGRKRAGIVHVLLSENREELNMDKAKDTYKHVQNTIRDGRSLELYADVERLLPDHIEPKPLLKPMDIQEYVREDGRKKSMTSSTQAQKKRKRDTDVNRNIPPGASTGFIAVRDLLTKPKKKTKRALTPELDLEHGNDDDEVDRELELGLDALSRRAQSDVAHSKAKRKPNAKGKEREKGKSVVRKAKTIATSEPRKTKKRRLQEPSFSQQDMDDDSDDLDIERGLSSMRPVSSNHVSSASRKLLASPSHDSTMDSDHSHHPEGSSFRHSSRASLCHQRRLSLSPSQGSPVGHFVDLTDSDQEDEDVDAPMVPVASSPRRGISFSPRADLDSGNDMGWLLENDDDEPALAIVSSSPAASLGSVRRPTASPTKTKSRFTSEEEGKLVERSILDISDDSDMDVGESSVQVISTSDSPRKQASISSPSFPFTQPVRHAGIRRKRVLLDLSSDAAEASSRPPSPQVARRAREGHRPKRHKHNSKRTINGVWDDAAIHSGDETSEGSSGEENSEHESDREFLKELPPSDNASPSYAQTQIYRNSLLTQAPAGVSVPKFTKPPKRRGAFVGSISSRIRAPVLLSSSPRKGDEGDEYEFDSFLVDDEAAIVYDSE